MILSSLVTLIFASAALGQLACDNPVDPLKTKDIPAIDTGLSGFKAANVFTLVVTSRLVNNRSDASISFVGGSAACNYPVSSGYWTHTTDGAACTESWTGSIDWATLRTQCGLARSEPGDGYIYFDGELEVHQTEAVGSIRGTALTRDVATGMAFQIRFPTAIELASGEVRVFAPVAVEAAITAQNFASETVRGTAALFTSVQWPFVLVASGVNTSNPAAVSILSSSTVERAGVATETTFFLALDPASCSLTGDYQLSFSFACSPSYNQTDCPLQGEAGRVLFVLTSADLCAQFKENVDLTGSLAAYLPDYATLRNAFILGQRSYWRADVASTKVSIVASSLVAASTSYDSGALVPLYASSAPTAAGTAAAFSLDGNGGVPTQSRFSLLVSPALYPVPADAFRPAVMRCTVAVTYSNAAKRFVTRYGRLDLRIAYPDRKDQPISVEASVGLQGLPASLGTASPTAAAPVGGTGASPADAPASPPVWPVAIPAVLVPMCCFAIVGAALYRRRRRQRDAASESSSGSSLPAAGEELPGISRPSASSRAAREESSIIEMA